MRRRLTPVVLFLCSILCALPVQAGVLSYVSDLITASAPGAGSSHTIQFTLAADVPPSGTITITPVDAFDIPAGFDVSDMTFSVATSGPYVAQAIASSADATYDGISAVTGPASSLTITLNATQGLFAGDQVRVVLASTTAAQYDPTNPSTTGSYHIRINTANGSGSAIDHGTAMIAVIAPVSVLGSVVQHPPVISNGEPSGTVSADNPVIEISLTTDELATCRYATSTGIAYGSMPETFTPSLGTVFYTDLTGFVDGQSYAFYVRCISAQGDADTVDYPIAFTIAAAPLSNTSIVANGSAGSGGTGNFPNGSAYLYLGTVKLEGYTSPGASVTVLRDGSKVTSAEAASDGTFTATVNGLERGTYTFGTYATDSQGRNSSIDSETLTIVQGTTDTVTNIVLPPTISLASTSAALGSDVQVSGETVPGAQVILSLLDPTGGTKILSATSSLAVTGVIDGSWSITIPAADLSKGEYQIKAQAVQSADSSSVYSDPLTLDVGVSPSSCRNNADLNRDGKVNLIDFSIMLTAWNTSDEKADLNCDGTVNLADLSILLFHWTG